MEVLKTVQPGSFSKLSLLFVTEIMCARHTFFCHEDLISVV